MRRYFTMVAILILNLVLQTTLFQAFRVRGILPNTAIIIIVSYALLRGSVEGALVGMLSGLLQDIFFGTSIGYYALFGLLAGYICGRSHQDFYRENYLFPIILCATTTFVYECCIYLTGFLFSGNLDFFYYLINLIIPETVYTSVVSIFLYRLLFFINNKIELTERHKRRLF